MVGGLKRWRWAAAAVAGVLGATAALVVAHAPPSVPAVVETRAAALPAPPAGWNTTRTGGGGRSSRPTRRVRSRSRTRCGNGLGAADGGPSFEARAHALLRGGRRRGSDRRDIPGRWRSDPRVVPAGGVEPSGRIPACGAGERLRLHQDGGQPARPRDRHGIGRAGAGPEVRPLDAELHRPEWIPVYGVDRHPDPHHQRRLAHRSPRARARVSNWPCRAACCGPRVGPLGSGRAMRCHSRWWARRLGIPTGPAWSATTPRFCNRDFDTSRATGYIRFW